MTQRFAPICIAAVLGFVLAFVRAGAAGAGEAAGATTAAAAPVPAFPFAPSPARPPRIGEWLEYRVCYPADPLENALGANPIAPSAEEIAEAAEAAATAAEASATAAAEAPAPDSDSAGSEQEYIYLPPSSEPAAAWTALPLRLEVVQVRDDGCRAVMRFGGVRREVELPNRGGEEENEERAAEKFTFDPPPADTTQVTNLDGEAFTCQLTRRDGEGYGFARLWSRDLPFGLARFATRDVDIILVGKGTGLPPAFPLRLREEISPAPGRFYIHPPDAPAPAAAPDPTPQS